MQTEEIPLKMVKIKDSTHQKLVKMGKYSETMDDIIQRCIKAYEQVYGVVK